MDDSVKKCPYCDTPIPEECRSDRKYCPFKYGIKDYCKNAVNNKDTLIEYHSNKNLNKINNENRNCLRVLLGSENVREVSLQQLLDVGFKMNYHIQQATMRESGNPALLYIEFGLEQLDNNRYKIFKHGRKY